MRAAKRRWPEDLVSIPFPASEDRPSDGERWKFTARQPDPETALRYHRARSYDPTPARWTMEDPVGFAAADAHLDRYVGRGPTEAGGRPGPSPS